MSIVSMYLKLDRKSTGTSAMLEVAGSFTKMAWLEAQKQLQKIGEAARMSRSAARRKRASAVRRPGAGWGWERAAAGGLGPCKVYVFLCIFQNCI